jgi:hypothetical protein
LLQSKISILKFLAQIRKYQTCCQTNIAQRQD